MRVRVPVMAMMVIVLLAGPMASPAHAATSQGCSGSLSSTGPSTDSVDVPGPSGTDTNPFQLYWAEPISWTGQTPTPVTSGTWRLTVRNASWLFALGELVTGHIHGLTGTFNTGQAGTTFSNSFIPSSMEPVTLPGKYEIGFAVTGAGTLCTVALSVRVMDPPGRNPLFWLALLLIIAGFVLLWVFGISKLVRPVVARTGSRGNRLNNESRHIAFNAVAGLFIGIGVSLITTLYGWVGWSSTVPNLIIIVGLLLGLGFGLLPVRTVRRPSVTSFKSDYSSHLDSLGARPNPISTRVMGPR